MCPKQHHTTSQATLALERQREAALWGLRVMLDFKWKEVQDPYLRLAKAGRGGNCVLER